MDIIITFSCLKCDRCYISEENYILHNSKYKCNYPPLKLQILSKMIMNCEHCNDIFIIDDLYINHINKHKNPIDVLHTCTKCTFKDIDLKILRDHYIEDHKLAFCTICKTLFMSIEHLNYHIKQEHFNINFFCQYCYLYFKNKISYDDHIKTHNEFECSKCSGKFLSFIDLQEHSKNPCLKFKCTICFEIYDSSILFNEHIKTHDLQTKIICAFCQNTFTDNTINAHLKTHQLSFECKTCFKSFCEHNELDTHVKLHNNSDTITCNICNNIFADETSLELHNTEAIKFGHFKCWICSTIFRDIDSFKNHLNLHKYGIYFSCEECEFKTDTYNELILHKTSHKKIEHICNICNIYFNEKNKYDIHMENIHTKIVSKNSIEMEVLNMNTLCLQDQEDTEEIDIEYYNSDEDIDIEKNKNMEEVKVILQEDDKDNEETSESSENMNVAAIIIKEIKVIETVDVLAHNSSSINVIDEFELENTYHDINEPSKENSMDCIEEPSNEINVEEKSEDFEEKEEDFEETSEEIEIDDFEDLEDIEEFEEDTAEEIEIEDCDELKEIEVDDIKEEQTDTDISHIELKIELDTQYYDDINDSHKKLNDPSYNELNTSTIQNIHEVIEIDSSIEDNDDYEEMEPLYYEDDGPPVEPQVEVETYLCRICNNGFIIYEDFINHVRTHF